MKKKFIKDVKRIITNGPLMPFLIIGIVLIIVIGSFSIGYYKDDSKNFIQSIISEAHGMLFDIIMFGIVVSLINKSRDKKLEIKRYHEEIEDYRGRDESIVKYHITGIIKRLVEKGETMLPLNNMHLENSSLVNLNLSYSNLSDTNLSRSEIHDSNLSSAKLNGAQLVGANVIDVNFGKADLTNVNLSGANLQGADFNGAELTKVNFEGANLENVNFDSAHLQLCQLKDVKSLKNAIMPDGTPYNAIWAKRIKSSKKPVKK